MIDLRYHVYSLAAVFFALAIGIVIGTSFVGKPADREQMLRIAERYERNLEGLQNAIRKQQNDLRSTRADFNRAEKMCETLMPLAFKDKLLYHNVAIVQTGDYDELTTSLRTVIEASGGTVTSVTKISSSFDFENPNDVSEALIEAGIVQERDESGRTAILHTIAEALVNARNADKLRSLEENKVINLSGDYTRWNRNVVVIGGSVSSSSHQAEVIDAPLIDELISLGANVVACEPLNAKASYVQVWKRHDVSTIDNADRSCGKAALLCAIGGEKGHFGQKRTADRLIPKTLESTND
ncbi:MAG TPA: copper transporter [Armatimonadota bacterium]|nr:copper transporter [Armatimonadota bacterium]